MKKLLLLFLLSGQFIFAQQIDVLSLNKIDKTSNVGFYHPVFSPDNQYLLTTDMNYDGLQLLQLSDFSTKMLTSDKGAGYGDAATGGLASGVGSFVSELFGGGGMGYNDQKKLMEKQIQNSTTPYPSY